MMRYHGIVKVVKGNKQIEITKDDFAELISNYERVEIDLGTGDGRYVFKKAQENSGIFFVGIDPNAKQLELFSKKSQRKKILNNLFVVGSIEHLPEELENSANLITVILPWGSLLQAVVEANTKLLEDVKTLFSKSTTCQLKLILGYTRETEPSETGRLALPDLSEEFLTDVLIPKYTQLGFNNTQTSEITKKDLKKLGTSWGNKLTFGKDRKLFQIDFEITR